MTIEEIEDLLARSEWSIKTKHSIVPTVSWLITLTSTSLLAFTSVPAFMIGWGGILSVVSIRAHWDSWQALSNFKRKRALELWDYIGSNGRLGYGTPMPPEIRQFGGRIAGLYERDPQAEHFPLSQALQLVDIYHRQHQRLSQLTLRLKELDILRMELSLRLDRLYELGEDNEHAELNLHQFEEDITTIKTMRDQIEASCHRLEMLLISIEKTYEIRQLNQEITGLATRASASPLASRDETESLANIERQIGHEIETFLRLERETDKHLQ